MLYQHENKIYSAARSANNWVWTIAIGEAEKNSVGLKPYRNNAPWNAAGMIYASPKHATSWQQQPKVSTGYKTTGPVHLLEKSEEMHRCLEKKTW